MIKISHEVPLEILEESRRFNDYDYCLVHLLDFYPKYKKFYQESVKMGRVTFLDNSCYELGESVPNETLLKGVQEINPSHVIAPDYLDDKQKTLEATQEFVSQLGGIGYKGEVIYVLQGSTYLEYVECHKIYQELYNPNWIAIPFDIKCFHEEAEKFAKTKTQVFAFSRNILIDKMMKDKVIDYDINYHLLGCSDPIEYMNYTMEIIKALGYDYSFIKSVDTSCPIILSMFGEKLPVLGLGKEKRSEKIADNLHYTFTPYIKNLMYENIKRFKKFYLGREE